MTARSTDLVALAAHTGDGGARTSALTALVAYSPPATRKVMASDIMTTVATEGRGIPCTTQLVALVAWRQGPRTNYKARAWGFTFDGHPFYVLHLGMVGTYVYDLSTEQWQQWRTAGLPTWNMEHGVTWNRRVVAGDNQNPTLWALDPRSFLDDDYKGITRTVTGGFNVRTRDSYPVGALRVTASLGAPQIVDATLTMRYSDDDGKTWSRTWSMVIEAGKFRQDLSFRSLGSMRAPGRIFELTDNGGLARIDGADADIGGFEG